MIYIFFNKIAKYLFKKKTYCVISYLRIAHIVITIIYPILELEIWVSSTDHVQGPNATRPRYIVP